MLHILLLAVFTAAVATLTLALIGFASMLSLACRSGADGRFRLPRLGLSPAAARPERSESGA